MSKIISIINQREDTGKTTTAVNIATSLALFEKKTLLIDCDPQSHMTNFFGIGEDDYPVTLYQGFMGKAPAQSLMVETSIDYLKRIPTKTDLFLAEHKLAIKPGKELTLQKIINKIKNDFEYIIIDSPSSLGFFTICAMAASEWVLIPITCQPQALNEYFQLLEIFHMVQEQLNPSLKIAGTLFNRCSGLDEANQYFTSNKLEQINYKKFTTTIPSDNIIHDSFSTGKPVAVYDISASVADVYFNLSVELMNTVT